MRILIPTVDYPPIEGGISTVARETAHALAGLGHEVTVVAPFFPDMAAFDAAEPARVVRFRGYRAGWLRLGPFLARAWPLVREADLILAINVAYGGVLARLARLWRGTPYVVFAYAYEFLRFRHTPVVASLYRSIYHRARVTVAISRFTRDNLCRFGVADGNIATILPGAREPVTYSAEVLAALRARLGIEDGRIILSVGRFVPRKGHAHLVRAMGPILEACPNTHLVLVGRGPCLDDCITAARAMGIEGFVHFPGCLPDAEVAALYQMCDVFALPTGEEGPGQVEGFGLVFVEAGAYGKPVVAGRSGGVAEAVLDGETGLLTPPGDPDALARGVIRLLQDRALAQRLGAAGRARYETELNWPAFARRVLEAAGLQL